jgi:sortase A
MDDRENLNRGPGHVPGTAFPGMPGNVFIAGHRTTYGAPFGRIDELQKGDKIIFTTAEGKQVYTVYETRIAEPTDLSVLEQEGEPRVSLMACHPRYSASKRMIVLGRLTGGDIK